VTENRVYDYSTRIFGNARLISFAHWDHTRGQAVAAAKTEDDKNNNNSRSALLTPAEKFATSLLCFEDDIDLGGQEEQYLL